MKHRHIRGLTTPLLGLKQAARRYIKQWTRTSSSLTCHSAAHHVKASAQPLQPLPFNEALAPGNPPPCRGETAALPWQQGKAQLGFTLPHRHLWNLRLRKPRQGWVRVACFGHG